MTSLSVKVSAGARKPAAAWRPAYLAAAFMATFIASQAPAASISQGRAKTITPNLLPCQSAGSDVRVSAVGTVKSTDGRSWTVPADTNFAKGPKASDLYNACNNTKPAGLESIEGANLPVAVVDKDGEIITGYLFADNYFELYVNGKLVAVDPVPYSPPNSAVVRFKAKRPITYAVKLVDWEENLGLGTEQGANGAANHPGDGGFIARFSDGTVTDDTWKAQSFYISPLGKPSDVVERGNVHDSSQLGRNYPTAATNAACATRCYAAHYPLPSQWASPKFDDRRWPNAVQYTDEEVGINNAVAYTAFSDAFSGARFIWSSNLVYDNVVLARKIVK